MERKPTFLKKMGLLFTASLMCGNMYAQFTTSTKTITAATPNDSGGLGTSSNNLTTVLGPVTGVEPLRSTYLGASGRYIGNSKTYFNTYKDAQGVWYLVDPDGYQFYSLGVNSVNTGTDPQNSLKANVGANTLGKWVGTFTKTMPYTVSLDFSFSYKNTQGARGDALYANGILPIFDVSTSGSGVTHTTGFVNYCNSRAASLITTDMITDKLIFGYWTDNEVPLGNPYSKYLINVWTDSLNYKGFTGALGTNDPNYIAAVNWVKARHGGTFTINTADKQEFPNFVAGKYYQVCRDAIKLVDTNHLIIGSRLHQDLDNPSLLSAARQYLDIVTVNYYRRWTPVTSTLDVWAGSGTDNKPFIISEFYAMADGFGMTNRSGAGWVVNTQQERADFFENFTMGILKHKNSVGFHWFRCQDDGTIKNNGLVDASWNYWAPIKDSYYKVAKNVYNLRNWLIYGQPKGIVEKDSYIRTGTYADDNYGTSTDINVKESTYGGIRRRGLLLATADFINASEITSAKIKLYCKSIEGTGPYSSNVSLYSASGTWYEGSVTYNNAPTLGTLQATTLVDAVGKYYTWDVTNYVKDRANAGLHSSSFMILTEAGSSLVAFNSKESTTNKPIFEINGYSFNGISAMPPNQDSNLITSIEQPESSQIDFTIHPNPVKNNLKINLAINNQVVSLSIFNLQGQLVEKWTNLKVENQKIDKDISSLKSGVYLVEVKGGSFSGKAKFIKE